MSQSLDPAVFKYGSADATLQACGGESGLRTLVDHFYDIMSERDYAQEILHMHPADLDTSRDKLARFLTAWMGGPKRYQEKYGPISIPGAHAHLPINANHRDAWLRCMSEALDELNYPDDFKTYLLAQLRFPAERIREVCQKKPT